REAGRQLAAVLERFSSEDPLVLALPRGGVPVGFEVAKALGAPLELVFVRKIGAPGHPELGVGALVDGAAPHVVVHQGLAEQLQLPPGWIEKQAKAELGEIERRRALYSQGVAPAPVRDRTVLVVDDGIATGGSVRAVLEALSQSCARKVVLAVPVAPPDTV